jgi:antitoxin FitA
VGQVLIRQIPDETVLRLKERARLHGRSLEHELREILSEAVLEPSTELAKIREAFNGKRFSDSSDLIRER